jgi:hypothetical protein
VPFVKLKKYILDLGPHLILSGRQRTEAPSAATAPKSIQEASYRRSYADSFTLATCFYPCLSGRSR